MNIVSAARYSGDDGYRSYLDKNHRRVVTCSPGPLVAPPLPPGGLRQDGPGARWVRDRYISPQDGVVAGGSIMGEVVEPCVSRPRISADSKNWQA